MKKIILLVVPILVVFDFSPALAVEKTEENIDEIVVSATGIPTPVTQIGAAVELIDAEELRQQQIIYLQDALKLKGINVVQNGGAGTLSNVFLRGLPGRYTSLEVDGISLFDPFYDQVLWNDVTADNVERVEIFRGAQGVLYGSSTIAGVISQATKIGGPAQHTARLEGGAFNTGALVLTSRGEAGVFAYGVSLGVTKTDGISAISEKAGGTEDDGYENSRFNGRSDIKLSNAVTLELAARHATGEADYDKFGSDVEGKGQNFTRQAGRVGLVVQHDFVKHIFDATGYDSETEQVDNFVAATPQKATRDKIAYRGIFNLAQSTHLMVGAESITEETTTHEADMAAAYVLLQVPLGEAVTMTLAGRRDDHELFGNHDTQRLTLAYNAIDALTLRTAYGTGFKAPTLSQLFDTTYGNKDLQPETADSAEVGFDFAFGQSGRFTTTLFQVEIENLIDWVSVPPGSYTGEYRQVKGTRESEGVEV